MLPSPYFFSSSCAIVLPWKSFLPTTSIPDVLLCGFFAAQFFSAAMFFRMSLIWCRWPSVSTIQMPL